MPSIRASFPMDEWFIKRHAKTPPICQRHTNPPMCRVIWRLNGHLGPHQPKKNQGTWIKWQLEKNVTLSIHCFQKMSEHSKDDSTNSIGSSGENGTCWDDRKKKTVVKYIDQRTRQNTTKMQERASRTCRSQKNFQDNTKRDLSFCSTNGADARYVREIENNHRCRNPNF